MTLGQRIQLCRKRRGFSQEQLGDQIGVSRQAVSKWEQDTARPDVDKIIALAEFFEITADELLKGIPGEPEDDGTKWPINQDAPFRGWKGRKLPYTKFQIGCTICGCVIIVINFVFLLLQYHSMPQIIPTHWNFSGQPNDWNGKGAIWWMFLLSVIIYAVMEILCHFPAAWNVVGNLTEGNWQRVYRTIRSTLQLTNIILLLLFFYIELPMIYPQMPIDGPVVLFTGASLIPILVGVYRIHRMSPH